MADWLTRVAKVMFTHFPSGEARTFRERIDKRSGRRMRFSLAGQRLKRMGLLEGVSDYIIFDPPPSKKFTNVFLFIEIKARRGDGGRPPTVEQQRFIDAMIERGHLGKWFYGADEAIDWLKGLGYGR